VVNDATIKYSVDLNAKKQRKQFKNILKGEAESND